MSSFLTQQVTALEDVLAGLSSFRSWCGAADAAAAKAGYLFGYDTTTDAAKPARGCALSDEDDWSMQRDADGAGQDNYGREIAVGLYFWEVLGEGVEWTAVNRQAFLDALAGIWLDLLNGCDAGGLRVTSLEKISWTDDFQMRCIDELTGRRGYQYGVRLTTRI
jgi:hypothetical protein